MADGTITFSTELDNSQLEADLKKAEKDVDNLKKKLERKEHDRSVIAEQMRQAQEEIDGASEKVVDLMARLEELKAAYESGDAGAGDAAMKVAEELNSQTELLERKKKKLGALADKWDKVCVECKQYGAEIDAARQTQSGLASEFSAQASKSNSIWARATSSIRSRLESTADAARNSFSRAADQAAAPWETFSRKLAAAVKKVFVFSMIVKAVKAVKNEMASIMGQNSAFAASVENLKAVCRGFIASFAQAVMPALKMFVDTLAGVLERVAGIVDAIFGTGILSAIQAQREQASAQIQQANAEKRAKYENEVAKAEERQAKAAKKLAKEQEKANRSLMGFDEINALSAQSSEEAADAMEDYMDGIEAPDYETDWTKNFAPDAGILSGLLDWLDELKRRILGDVEGPFARIREGLELIKQGWEDLLRGLETGDWQLVWESIGNIVIGALYVAEGAIGAFLDWFDEITGGRFHTTIEGIKLILHGVVEFIEGVLRGDMELAFQGIYDVIDGAALTIDGQIITALDNLDKLTGGKFHDIFEALKKTSITEIEKVKDVLHGLVEFVEGVLTGDMDKAIHGIMTVFTTLSDSVRDTMLNVLDLVQIGINKVFDWLEEKLPWLEPMLELVRQIINNLIDSATSLIGDFFDWLDGAVENVVDVIVGIVTGDGDRIVDGLKGIVNSLIDILNGALGGVGDFVNLVADGISSFISFVAPDASWSFGLDMPQIPYLAQGAVIPPNRQFLAVLGDQTSGTNLEAPESLMRQIVREESGGGNAEMLAVLYALLDAVRDGKNIYMDGTLMGRAVRSQLATMTRMSGV